MGRHQFHFLITSFYFIYSLFKQRLKYETGSLKLQNIHIIDLFFFHTTIFNDKLQAINNLNTVILVEGRQLIM